MSGYLVIIKDLQGYRLGKAVSSELSTYKMDDGRLLSQDVCMATQENLTRIALGTEPVPVGPGSFQWPLKAELAINFLEMEGMRVDDDLRLRRRLGAPFCNLKPGHVPAIVMGHLKIAHDLAAEARAEGKIPADDPRCDPGHVAETRPVNLLQHEGHILLVRSFPDKMYLVPDLDSPGDLAEMAKAAGQEIPEDLPRERGKLTMLGRQLGLTWQDYTLIPKGPNILMIHKFLNVEDAPFETLEEMEKQGKFVGIDGVVWHNGRDSLLSRDLSIDDFLK